MKRYLLVLYCLLACFTTNAQTTSGFVPAYYKYELHSRTDFSLLTAYNFGKYDYGEVGLTLNNVHRRRKNSRTTTISISDELKVANKFIMGPKVGFWISNYAGIGANLICYTDFTGTAVRFRPEAGFGMNNWKLVYGYNIPLTNSSFAGVSSQFVTCSVLWKLKRTSDLMKEKDWDGEGRRSYMSHSHKDTSYSRDYGLFMLGINGWKYTFGEVGFAFYSKEKNGLKNDMTFLAFFGTEFSLNKQVVWGPKIGMTFCGHRNFGLVGGLSLIYYTGSGYNDPVIRPEIGLHINTLRLVYGYNHILTNSNYGIINENNVSAIFGLKMGKGKNSSRTHTESKNF